ncbi:hypothetical protein GCM10009787_14160 [Streptomyces bangladeshensis]|uniref:Uncharacterized protein n=1 Tax=Streptomyces bangladeshensis TaxID=295352 RepID=A0ABP5N6T0_9ACTN
MPEVPSAAAPARRDAVTVRREIGEFIGRSLRRGWEGAVPARPDGCGRQPVSQAETARTASSIRSTTRWGWESITRWEESTSTVVMPARW